MRTRWSWCLSLGLGLSHAFRAPYMGNKEESWTTQWRMGRTTKTLLDIGDATLDLRIMPRDRSILHILGARGNWWLSLPSRSVMDGVVNRQSCEMGFLSSNGEATYRANYDRDLFSIFDTTEAVPVLWTDRVPLFGLSTGLRGHMLLGLCSESVLVRDLGKPMSNMNPSLLYTGMMGGTCLCGALCGTTAFLGTVSGTVIMINLRTLTMRRLNTTVTGHVGDVVRSVSVAQAAMGRFHVAVGREGGRVDVYETPGAEPRGSDRHLFSRVLHTRPICSMSLDRHKLVTADEGGRIIIGDAMQNSAWYETQLGSPCRVATTERFLVLSFGRYLEIWDYDPSEAPTCRGLLSGDL